MRFKFGQSIPSAAKMKEIAGCCFISVAPMFCFFAASPWMQSKSTPLAYYPANESESEPKPNK